MYRAFLVTEGLSIIEDIPPTSNVQTLQTSLSRKCGVRTKDVILLSPKGYLLDSKETLGAYDAGTEEKPVFVFLRPDSVDKRSLVYTPYRPHPSLGVQLDHLSSSPSPSALQHQLAVGRLIAGEAVKLSNHIQELRIATKLQCVGWRALVNNFTTIHRSFEKHHRAFGWSLINLQESKPSYEELLAKSPQQLEVLKRINLSPSLGQGVFQGSNGSLYDWISSQDEHSSLPDLVRECGEALTQINESSLNQLQSSSSQLMTLADQLTKSDSVKVIPKDVNTEQVTRIVQEQQSMAQSLQSTIQRVLGSGDAGALANVSLSNQRLVQLMYNNHKTLESILQELEGVRRSLKDTVENGLRTVAEIQQQMIESNTQLLFHSEHLQLTRRRFEVLEQIYASPQTLANVVFEIEQRKQFKREYTNFAQRMAERLESFRQNEKLRRQKFLESHSQHFVLSLFPSFTDRIPHFINTTQQSFDDDLCHLSTDTLNEMSQWLPRLTTPPTRSISLYCDSHSQTHDVTLQEDRHVLPVMESQGVQCSPDYTHMGSQMEPQLTEDGCVQTVGVNKLEVESQTAYGGVDTCVQTIGPAMTEKGLQVKISEGEDGYTQTDSKESVDNGCQTILLIGVDCCVQTNAIVDEEGTHTLDTESQTDTGSSNIIATGSDDITATIGSQTLIIEANDSCVQTMSIPLVNISSQTTHHILKDMLIQTEPINATSIAQQTEHNATHCTTQTVSPGYLAMGSQTHFIGQNQFSQTHSPQVSTIGSQTRATPIEVGMVTEEPDGPLLSPGIMRQPSESAFWPVHSPSSSGYLAEPGSNTGTEPGSNTGTETGSYTGTEPGSHTGTETGSHTINDTGFSPTNSITDLEGQVVALQAAVSGLKTQLRAERDTHKKQLLGVERELKHVQRSQSIGRDTEEATPPFITVGSLRVGDTALFIQDGYSNFLALTVDGRMYYLNHSSAERFRCDISSRVQAPLKSRKVLMGMVTEKLLVEVRKESNRLKVPVGQRLYKLSARETTLPALTT